MLNPEAELLFLKETDTKTKRNNKDSESKKSLNNFKPGIKEQE